MASGPISSWQIEGGKVEAVTDFILFYFISLGSKITMDGDCSHELKRCLLLGRKQSRQHIKKQRLHLADKGLYSQSYDFSSRNVHTWELDHKEGWVIKNWCSGIVVLSMRVPWTARRSKQSVLKEINPEYSLEGLMLKLKLQNLGYLIWRVDSLERPWCWKRLRAGRE